MLNHSELMGRLTADPELRYTGSGTAVTSFTLANDTGRKRGDGSRITNFIDCVAWRQQAEFAAKYLTKGRLIVVEGEMTPRTYDDKNGVRHKVTELNVDKIHFADSKNGGDNNAAPEAPAGSSPDGFTEVGSDEDLPF